MTSAIPAPRSNRLSNQANWELVICEFVNSVFHLVSSPGGHCILLASFFAFVAFCFVCWLFFFTIAVFTAIVSSPFCELPFCLLL